MREMKESGISWIGKIPEGWRVEKLKYHLVRNEPRNPGNQQILSVYRKYGVIPKDSRDDNYNVTSEDTSKYKYVKKGVLVINKMKAWQGALGVSEFEGVVSPAYFIYKFIDELLFPGYIHYLLRNCYKTEFRRISGGIREGQWDLSPTAFENALILIPNYKEQKAISDYLDTKCAEIDALQKDIEKEIETLKAYKKSLITQAVSKGLNPHVEMKDSGIEWIGKINSKWKLYRLRYLLKEPLKYGASETGVEYDDTLPRYIRITDIQDNNTLKKEGKLSLTFEQAKGYLLTEETVLFARSGATVGKTFLYKPQYGIAAFAGYLIAAVLNKNKMFAKWLFYYTNSSIYWNWINNSFSQSTIQNIGADKYKNLIVVCPPIEEQNKIMHLLESKCAEIDSIIASKQKQSEILVEYKKSLIYELVTGKKEVPVHE